MMPEYLEWIAKKRREAVARGGKPLRNLPSGRKRELPFTFPAGRKKGEIINPLTGEIVTGCLVIAKVAVEMGVTTHQLTDRLEATGLVKRVLRAKEVPMVVKPSLTKPLYYHTPEATVRAVEDGFLIPLPVRIQGIPIDCILVTPDGQRLCRELTGNATRAFSKIEQRKLRVAQLLEAGCTQTQISSDTDIPKQTVSRIVRALREMA